MKYSIILTFTLLLAACSSQNKAAEPKEAIIKAIVEEIASKAELNSKNIDSLILESSDQVLQSIKEQKWSVFASYIHPIKGARFSPYACIDTITHISLTQTSFIPSLHASQTWGLFDGSGEPIILTTNAYIQKFVYNADFLNAEQRELNTIIAAGNSLNNLLEIYPKSQFTEHYFAGFDKQYEGMDWTTLRLVYEEYQGSYFLIAVIHDQWTI